MKRYLYVILFIVIGVLIVLFEVVCAHAGGGATMMMVMGSPPAATGGAWYYSGGSDSYETMLDPTTGRAYGADITVSAGTSCTQIGIKMSGNSGEDFKIALGTLSGTTWTLTDSTATVSDSVVGWNDYNLTAPVAKTSTMAVLVNFSGSAAAAVPNVTQNNAGLYKNLAYASFPESPSTGMTVNLLDTIALRVWCE